MGYRTSHRFAVELPWKSRVWASADEEDILAALSKGWPAAKPFAERVFVEGRKDHKAKKPSTEGLRVIAARCFSESGYASLNNAQLGSFWAKTYQHQFLDAVLSLVDEESVHMPVSPTPPYASSKYTLENVCKGFRHLPDLQNWGTIVLEAHETFRTEKLLDEGLGASTASTPDAQRLHNSRRHFSKANSGAILGNLSSIIFMAGYLLQGKLDIPSKMDAFKEELDIKSNKMHFLNEVLRGTKLCQLRAPLMTALCISPICSLLKISLEARHMSEGAAFLIWTALGADKPLALRRVERRLWQFIFTWAGESRDVQPAIPSLLKDLVEIVKGASPEDLVWFSDGTGSMEDLLPQVQPSSSNYASPPGTPNTTPPQSPAPDSPAPDSPENDAPENDAPDTPRIPPASLSPSLPNSPSAVLSPPASPERPPSTSSMDERGLRDKASKAESKKRRRGSSVNQASPTRKKARRRTGGKERADAMDCDADPASPPKHQRLSTAPKLEDLYTAFMEQVGGESKPISLTARVEKRFVGREMKVPLPTADGTPSFYTFIPAFHQQSELDLVEAVYKAFEPNLYVPLKDDRMPFRIVPWEEYQKLPPGNILETFRNKSLVIVDRPLSDSVNIPDPVQFNEEGLKLLGPLSRRTTLHDLSTPLSKDSGYEARHTSGTLKDLLAASSQNRSVNMLDCPFFTDYGQTQVWDMPWTAWQHTATDDICREHGSFPMHVCRWGLAATSGCVHTWHVDANGLLSVITTLCGVKIFVLGVPKAGFSLSSTCAFEDFDISGTNADMLDIFMIALKPNTQYIQNAQQLHLVITPEHSIALGGHSYVTTAIQQTTHAIYHQFVAGYDVTNGDHPKESLALLSTMVVFFHQQIVLDCQDHDEADKVRCHLPRLSSFEGVLDLVCLVQLMELITVLWDWAYEAPLLHTNLRFNMIRARGLARELLNCVFGTYRLLDQYEDGIDGMNDFFYPYLVEVCVSLSILKRQHQESSGELAGARTMEEVKRAIRRVLLPRQKLVDSYEKGLATQEHGSFAYTGYRYTVERRLPAGRAVNIGKPQNPACIPELMRENWRTGKIDGWTFDDLETGILG